MGFIKNIYRKKIKASSLLEVLVAMVILLIIFFLSMNVFSNERINKDYHKVDAIIATQNKLNAFKLGIDRETIDSDIFNFSLKTDNLTDSLIQITLTTGLGDSSHVLSNQGLILIQP